MVCCDDLAWCDKCVMWCDEILRCDVIWHDVMWYITVWSVVMWYDVLSVYMYVIV